MKIISGVFHPLLIATHLTVLLIIKTPELLHRIQPVGYWGFIRVVFIITALLPALSLFLLRAFRYISDFELTNKKERVVPFAFILFYYSAASYLFMERLELDYVFNLVMVSVTVLIALLLIITFRFKISIHAAAVWSAAGYLTAISVIHGLPLDSVYYVTILIAGLTTTSRLYLGRHTSREAWAGSILGFAYSFSVFLLFA